MTITAFQSLLFQFGQSKVVSHFLKQIRTAHYIHSCHRQGLGCPQGVQLGLFSSWQSKKYKAQSKHERDDG